MKRFSMPSIDREKAARLLALLCLSVMLGSCVSTPDAGGNGTAADEPSVSDGAVDGAAVGPAVIEAKPQVVDSTWRRSPAGLSEGIALAEPTIVPVEAPASPSAPETAGPSAAMPVDITVLSAAAPVSFAPVALPEPAIAPARAAEKAPEAPVAKAPAVAPPIAKAPAPPIAKAPAPKAPAAKPEPKSKEPESPAAPAVPPAKSLGPAPASSARVVDAGATEQRIDEARAVAKGERFELRFPGSGWIYLGDEDGKEGVRYETRRFEGTEAIFALRPETVGEYVLRFQRQDPLDGSTDSRLVKVAVSPELAVMASSASETVPKALQPATASAPASPAAPASAPLAAAAPSTAPVAAPSPAAPAAVTPLASSPAIAPATLDLGAISDPDRLLALARSELEAKRTQSALAVLDRYRELFPYGGDELFFLYGLAYEQDTPFRNVKKAHEAYKRVRDEYPRSRRWREAADRIAFLERHYFGLR